MYQYPRGLFVLPLPWLCNPEIPHTHLSNVPTSISLWTFLPTTFLSLLSFYLWSTMPLLTRYSFCLCSCFSASTGTLLNKLQNWCWDLHMRKNMRCLSFWIWITLFIVTFLIFIYLAEKLIISFLVQLINWPIVYKYCISIIRHPMDTLTASIPFLYEHGWWGSPVIRYRFLWAYAQEWDSWVIW